MHPQPDCPSCTAPFSCDWGSPAHLALEQHGDVGIGHILHIQVAAHSKAVTMDGQVQAAGRAQGELGAAIQTWKLGVGSRIGNAASQDSSAEHGGPRCTFQPTQAHTCTGWAPAPPLTSSSRGTGGGRTRCCRGSQ